jgi:hypothetical protein
VNSQIKAHFSELMRDAIAYLKVREVEQAFDLLTNAMKFSASVHYNEARNSVSEINSAIRALRRNISRIEQAIEDLPEDLRFDAFHRLQPILDIFREELSELYVQKRRTARGTI